MITDFPSPPIGNMPGVKLFKFVPYRDIETLPPVSRNRVLAPVVLKAGKEWLNGYSTANECVLNETSSKDGNGDLYDWEIPGFLPGNGEDPLTLMADMEFDRYLVMVHDHSGNLRLAGYNAPLEFSASFTTGKVAGTDVKGYSYRFFGQYFKRAPIFLG